MNLKAVIIDDEQAGINVLVKLIDSFIPNITILETYNTAQSAILGIKETNPDIVFSDIEMPEMSGIDLISHFKDNQFDTIFITAHQKYAIQAIRKKAFDYLLKPIRIKELLDVNERLIIKYQNTSEQNQDNLILTTAKKVLFVPKKDIIMVKGEGSYSQFFIKNNPIQMVSKNLAYYEREIDSKKFFRAHQSYLINTQHVKNIDLQDGLKILLSEGHEAMLSSSKKSDFIKTMQAF